MDSKIGRWLLLAGWLLIAGMVWAQEERRELEFEEVPSNIIVTGDAAVLVVESTVSPLSFDSRGGGIRTVRETEPGTYQIVLAPDMHYIEIRAEGFMMLRLPRWNFEPRMGRRVRVRAKPQLGAVELFEANRPELRLDYAPAAGEEVYVQLDQHPPQKLDFSRGWIILRPTPGAHTVKAYAGGRLWERTLTLETGQRYQETVAMAAGVARAFTAQHAGNLFVESTPPGAQVQQPRPCPRVLRPLP